MAKRVMKISLGLALVVAMICAPQESLAQSGCTTAIISLAPCLGFITGNSSTPSPSCCTQLANVVQSNALCLCQLLNGGGSSFGVTINQTQALTLPGACKVQTPPASQCNAGTPASSPSASPATPTPTTPSTPSTPGSSTPTTPATPSSTPSGSKNTPGDSSSATTATTMFPVLFVSAFVLSLTAF